MQENSAEIVIKDGIIQSPTWLVNAVDSVAQSHQKGEDYLYPSVYNIQEGTNHYILVWDLVNSNLHEGQLFYTTSGERMDLSLQDWNQLKSLDKQLL